MTQKTLENGPKNGPQKQPRNIFVFEKYLKQIQEKWSGKFQVKTIMYSFFGFLGSLIVHLSIGALFPAIGWAVFGVWWGSFGVIVGHCLRMFGHVCSMLG